MKICGIICEYNPFHNGHLYQLQEAKRLSGADAVLCVMSGNFVQRGDAAILEKYTRARHAVLAGADAVIELPTVFATSNAEIFAKGAIHILSQIPDVTTLCFGAEIADKQAFLTAATLFNEEPKEISEKIKTFMSQGKSYAKARSEAWKDVIPTALLSEPNNILGIEYTRAILSAKKTIDILPIQRLGGGYKQKSICGPLSSATAIRKAIDEKKDYANALPRFVAEDLPDRLQDRLDCLEKYAILCNTTEKIAQVCDCVEGLENALKKAGSYSSPLAETLTSARYTASRIRRIALQNLLNIDEECIRTSLTSSLYLRILAINKNRKDLLSALSKTISPLLIRTRDEKELSSTAYSCLEKDLFAEKVYALLYDKTERKEIFI